MSLQKKQKHKSADRSKSFFSGKPLKKLPKKNAGTKKKKVEKETTTINLTKEAKDFKTAIDFIKRDFKHKEITDIPYNLKPTLATLTDEPFNSNEWQFEIKWDGYRALAYLENGKVQLKSRNNLSFNDKYESVINELQKWKINAVVDGEIVVLDEHGKVDFNALQQWYKIQEGELAYYVFDILWLDGIDLTDETLEKRREILKQIMPKKDIIRFSESIDEFGKDFFEIAEKNDLEGIIAKKKGATYQTGYRTKDWLKIKIEQRHEAVICGYTKNKDTDRLFSALILGIYKEGALEYIGLVGTGFSQSSQKEILKKLVPLTTKKCPFATEPKTGAPTVWIKPEIICEVKYTEITKDGVMRHPSFQGIREDKTVLDLNDERQIEIKDSEEMEKKQSKKKPTGSNKLITGKVEEVIVTIDSHNLKLTNLQKIYWPTEKITKGTLLNYYYSIAEYMMPYMKDRPQSLNRYPNGINGKSFYQKNMAGKVDKWLKTFTRMSESVGETKDFLICADTASLVYMANLGCIEMNPWHSRVQSPLLPDWTVIDLDPAEISFEKVIEAALVVKKVLDAMGVPSYPKTSGSTGMHIYVPLGAKYNYEQAKQFAELVANIVHDEIPSFTSIERNPQKRKDKIYLDYLQNRPIQTISAPYSVRPKPGATVSAPLHWSEVKKGLKMSNFTIHNILDRVKTEGDLFTGVIEEGIDLNEALKKLASLI